MKKVLTILMLTLSLATFSQNATKIVVLDTYNKGGSVSQTTLSELQTIFAQAISETHGFEGVVDNKVDDRLMSEGFAEHPRLSEEQAEWVSKLSGTQYALMSSASIDNQGSLSIQVILIELAAYQVKASEATTIKYAVGDVQKSCEALVKKIIVSLPVPQEPVVEEEVEAEEPVSVTKPSEKQENAEKSRTYPMPIKPQQPTGLEADEVSRHLNRADVCIEMNYIDNAIKEYNEIVKIVPGWANVYMYLGDTYTLKGDAASLQLAIECYTIFMQLTDDQTLYYEAQDKLSRVEMMTELKVIESKKEENLVGTWRTSLYDKYSGKPFFILNITKTPEPNKYQITVSPKSLMYNNIVNSRAYAEIVDGKMGFSYTFQETYIPKQSKYNLAGAAINSLFRDNPIANAIGNAVVESFREGDVGYTNIMDFDFVTEVDIKDDLYKTVSDAYMNGSCHFKGEHHQAGRSNVELDTIYPCSLLKGSERYPVLLKINIERKGLRIYYQYDDLKVKAKPKELTKILRMGGYVDAELDRIEKNSRITNALALVLGSVGLSGMITGGVLLAQDVYSDSDAPLIVFCSGVGALGIGFEIWQWGYVFKSSKIINLIPKHNKIVDENIRKYRQKDQANASVNMGLTPTGVGVSLNF